MNYLSTKQFTLAIWLCLLCSAVIVGTVSADWQFNPFTKKLDYYEADTVGEGGAGLWATSTDLAIYPTDITDVVIIGGNSTSSDDTILDITGNVFVDGNMDLDTGHTYKINGTDLTCSDITNCVDNAWDDLSDMPLAHKSIYVGNNSNNPEVTTTISVSDNNYVGIGTVSPEAKLHVIDTLNPQIRLERAGPGYAEIGTTNSGGILFFEEAVEKMRISHTSGNVGIGTTSPGHKLSVNGDIYTNGLYYGNIGSTTVLSSDHNIDQLFKDILNLGVLEAITISDDGGLDVSWTTGEMYDFANSQILPTNSGSGSCTNNSITYLQFTAGSATLTLTTTEPTGNNYEVGHINCQDGDIIDIHEHPIINVHELAIGRALGGLMPVIVSSGLIVSEDTGVDNTWDVQSSAGVYYHEGHAKHPVSALYSSTTPMVRHFKTGGAWDSNTNIEIDSESWLNGNDLASTSAAKYYKSMFILDGDIIHWVYGDTEFATVAQAIDGALPVTPPGLVNMPQSVAVVLRGDASAFPASDSDQWLNIRITLTSAPAGTITDYNNLINTPDLTVYLKHDGTITATGDFDWGGFNMLNIGNASTTLFSNSGNTWLDDDVYLKDNKKVYFSTGQTNWLTYDTNYSMLRIHDTGGFSGLAASSSMYIYANAEDDGGGNWDPNLQLLTDGTIRLQTITGSNRDVEITGTDYIVLTTGTSGEKIRFATSYVELAVAGGHNINLETWDSAVTGTKMFQFPNLNGTFLMATGTQDILTTGTATTTNLTVTTNSKLGTVISGTWQGTAITDAYISNTLTVDGYMQDTDINTLAKLNAWLPGETIASTTGYYKGTLLASSTDSLAGANATSTFEIPSIFEAFTITDILCRTDTGTSSLRIGDGTNWSEVIFCDSDAAEDDGSIANASFNAKEEIVIEYLNNYTALPLQTALTIKYDY